MDENSKGFSKAFHYKMTSQPTRIDVSNFTITNNEFMKYIPTKNPYEYLQVFKSQAEYRENLYKIESKIIFILILLLLIFALISYYLAKNALRPFQESIETLDKFTKDLIHDLNTPVTAMKLNIKLLEKNEEIKKMKVLARLKKSVKTISELRGSLTTLLENKTFQVRKLDVCSIVTDVLELHEPNYPNLTFDTQCISLVVNENEDALKQILHNLLSNACKYNKQNGHIQIYSKNKTLYIKDNGIPIKEAKKIFDREYSTQNSTGFGLDIAKRLCDAMDIKIAVITSSEGNCFSLTFR